MNSFFKTFHLSWSSFLAYLPALLGGIFCFILTLVLANFAARFISKYSLRKSKDNLVANFMGKIAWSVIFILGAVLTLGILGLGTISNKILAGAGITTFVVGFALKDISENFLAGLILAFGRPYHVGNFIECGPVKGVVRDMTMRQTTLEAENGRIILLPNSMIIKNPLIKHLHNENNLKHEFSLSVDSQKAEEAMKLIRHTILGIGVVSQQGSNTVKVIIDSLAGRQVKLLIIYWLNPKEFKGSISETRSKILFAVVNELNQQGIQYAG